MPDNFEQRIQEWMLDSDTGEEIQDVYELILGLTDKLFNKYEPQRGPYPDFQSRLEHWILNVPDMDDQKTLFRMLKHLFFVGRDEFETLYRVAYNTIFASWLLDECGLKLDAQNARDALSEASNRSWICPITDSMKINTFYHINKVSGYNYRPDWSSLSAFGDLNKINNYIANNQIKSILLLEDFVGSGSQIEPAIRLAASLVNSTIRVLVIPLVICPKGVTRSEELMTELPNISIRPVIRLAPKELVGPDPQQDEPHIFAAIRELVTRSYPQVCNVAQPGGEKPYSAFGYRETGAMVVTYANCPDNTLPLIHHRSETWRPLFPRSTRV